jgi:hypothetical protein
VLEDGRSGGNSNMTMMVLTFGGIAFGSDFAWDAVALMGCRFPLFSKENKAADLPVTGRHRHLVSGIPQSPFPTIPSPRLR